jgi:hypothetical protein
LAGFLPNLLFDGGECAKIGCEKNPNRRKSRMRYTRIIVAVALVGSLAGCLQNDAERGVAGAAAGAVIADATGNSAVTGAIIGAGAGVFCDDAGICN